VSCTAPLHTQESRSPVPRHRNRAPTPRYSVEPSPSTQPVSPPRCPRSGTPGPAVQLELEALLALTHPYVPAVHGRRVQLRRRPPTLPQPQLLAPRPRCRPGQAQQVAQADPSPRARARRPPPRGPQAPRPRQRRRGPRTRAGSGAGRRHAGRGSGRGEGADRGRLGASGRDREEAAGGVPGGRQLCVPLLFSSFSLPCSRYVR